MLKGVNQTFCGKNNAEGSTNCFPLKILDKNAIISVFWGQTVER